MATVVSHQEKGKTRGLQKIKMNRLHYQRLNEMFYSNSIYSIVILIHVNNQCNVKGRSESYDSSCTKNIRKYFTFIFERLHNIKTFKTGPWWRERTLLNVSYMYQNIIQTIQHVHSNSAVADKEKLCCLHNSARKQRPSCLQFFQPHTVFLSPVHSVIMKFALGQ